MFGTFFSPTIFYMSNNLCVLLVKQEFGKVNMCHLYNCRKENSLCLCCPPLKIWKILEVHQGASYY